MFEFGFVEGVGLDRFERDLDALMDRLRLDSDEDTVERLKKLRDKLVGLHKDNLVKINHSVMELVCARHLILRGYEVDVERTLNGLSCDLYGVKGFGSLIVEVETGFVPPEHALDPMTYCRARIASKVARYSGYSNKFCLGTPPHYIMPVPPVFIKPPRYRTDKEVREIKQLCDLYYSNPPVSPSEIKNARLHAIYLLDVEKGAVQEVDPEDYVTP
jgi:hypothetical protein